MAWETKFGMKSLHGEGDQSREQAWRPRWLLKRWKCSRVGWPEACLLEGEPECCKAWQAVEPGLLRAPLFPFKRMPGTVLTDIFQFCQQPSIFAMARDSAKVSVSREELSK
jgi:hypothetical protein